MIAALNKFLDVCERIGTVTASLLLALMLVAGFANVFIREVLGKGIIWIYPWTLVFFVWLVFIGYYVIFRRKSDVVLEFFVHRLGKIGRTITSAIFVIVTLFLNIVIVSQAPRIIALKQDMVEIVGIQDYFVTLPLFVSSALIIVSVLTSVFQQRG